MRSLAETLLDYRAYVMTDEGHIDDVRLIRASHDPAACDAVAGLGLSGPFELWHHDREVMCATSRPQRYPGRQGNPFGSGPLLAS